ncbi:hypothetical protein [Clostridium algidicarnis]|uniref:hypothetical protein n=1 Tax=Clostridium algidicarnis TaxID=37659 RepID=UPI000498465E|nr:hypothetical protein [Clostridium algidicarnis]
MKSISFIKTSLLIVFILLISNLTVFANVSDKVSNLTVSESISGKIDDVPNVPVRRIWHRSTKRTLRPDYIKNQEYFQYRGFEGWLSLVNIVTDEGGYLCIYEGYLYNPEYPIPSPAKVLDPTMEIEKTDYEVNTHKKYIYHTVNYKTGFDIKKYYVYNDGAYIGRLELDEIWGNKDGTWDAIYKGYVTSNHHMKSIED